MDSDLLLQLGVGGIFALLVIKEVLTFIGPTLKNGKGEHANGKGARDADCLNHIESMLEDLHEWHNIRDPRGVFVWYAQFGNEELRELVKAMADNVTTQTEVLKEVLRIGKENKEQLATLAKRQRPSRVQDASE